MPPRSELKYVRPPLLPRVRRLLHPSQAPSHICQAISGLHRPCPDGIRRCPGAKMVDRRLLRPTDHLAPICLETPQQIRPCCEKGQHHLHDLPRQLLQDLPNKAGDADSLRSPSPPQPSKRRHSHPQKNLCGHHLSPSRAPHHQTMNLVLRSHELFEGLHGSSNKTRAKRTQTTMTTSQSPLSSPTARPPISQPLKTLHPPYGVTAATLRRSPRERRTSTSRRPPTLRSDQGQSSSDRVSPENSDHRGPCLHAERLSCLGKAPVESRGVIPGRAARAHQVWAAVSAILMVSLLLSNIMGGNLPLTPTQMHQ